MVRLDLVDDANFSTPFCPQPESQPALICKAQKYGASDRIRTGDIQIHNLAL
jgi:hypothetical protein